MARIAILDDYRELGALVAGPLMQEGYDTMVETSPIDFETVIRFSPDVIAVHLYRKENAFDRPIRSVEEDVLGFKPLEEMQNYPAISIIPTMLVGIGLLERDVPTTVNYDMFLTFPMDLQIYLPKIQELAGLHKTKRHISNYICPSCDSRMTYLREPVTDLFCPRCHTSVSIIEGNGCLANTGDGEQISCSLEQLTPPAKHSKD
jgi:hypothetical protein